jgi:hypothetical protein
MNGGNVLNDLDDALREATKAALDAGGKSKVTLELVNHRTAPVPARRRS